MKPAKQYAVRVTSRLWMRELEAGDRPRDHEGRVLPFVPGDLFVQGPFQNYVLSQDLARTLYMEVEE